ncbi:MAG: ABC transporter permease [Candidatus Eisenbacteria bacterium]|uniref:ABC transporter permease n=1 Tax=Eiseniibacteriota bacterium TaxID=2212470 RepID=A0A538T4Q5_UNCEI|nr:MAG: ABC transporter permease [Candidatus Eisenbacteria bacterium]
MSLSLKKVATIAEREYLTTVRRKAFLFTVIGVPVLYTILFTIMIKPQMGEGARLMKDFRVLGLVDSSGAFADAEPEIRGTVATDLSSSSTQGSKRDSFRVEVRAFPNQAEADRALRAGEINQLLVVPKGYLETGILRRYVLSTNLVSEQDQTAVSGWVARSLLRNRVDPVRIERVARPAGGMELFTPSPEGGYARHDKRRELVDLLMPLAFAMLMGMCIVIGGQYLLQSIAEEKESRILESILCTVNAGELLTGKLIGLGGAGLTIVASWIAMGALLGGPVLALAKIHVPPAMLALAIVYFLFGYLFYGSIMTGIGAITNNMREAQQFSPGDRPVALPADGACDDDAAPIGAVLGGPRMADRALDRAAGRRGLARDHRLLPPVPHRPSHVRKDSDAARDPALGAAELTVAFRTPGLWHFAHIGPAAGPGVGVEKMDCRPGR